MAYYISSGKRRKKNVFLIILITITIIGSAATVGLTSGFFYVGKIVGENLINIETVKQDTANLQQQIDTSKEQLELYEKQLDKLNEQLLRFDPIIIPDSMLKE
ncbi:hypothetical protein [Cellulosilyticum sp. I15G10I2]|uniref:hypothetical protein n=1 Tax=Cellulosilyticum sp. I15G10I2 TaxID=1892843 RepID=UPI00085C7B38|nr:hypothetical protein [Cellulosilyticum sp. I15G10I2]